jgi:hypothetical protein
LVDGGGPRVASQLAILRELMWNIQTSKKRWK